MTRQDQEILYTAVACGVVLSATVATLAKQEIEPERAANYRLSRVSLIARQIEELCKHNLPFAFSSEIQMDEIDLAIEQTVSSMLNDGSMPLPQDRAMLLNFYNRLTQRKTEREHSAFLDIANDSMLARAVFDLLDKESRQRETQI